MTPSVNDPHRWLRDFPSTQATVCVGLVLGVLYVITSLVGGLMGRSFNEITHIAMASFILAMCGLNFAVKRFTDTGLAAARASGPSPVTVEAPSSVTVTKEQPATPTIVVPAPAPVPTTSQSSGALARDD